MITMEDLLALMVRQGGSDLHLSTCSPPRVRVDGILLPVEAPPLTADDTRRLATSVLNSDQIATLDRDLELDCSFGLEGHGRFRANVFFQQGAVAAVLRSIPDDFYEAAELDGAGFWRKLSHITLPRLRPVIAMMLIFHLIGALQVFDQPFIMTGGGPGDVTRTVGLYIYDIAFANLDFGKGTALAVVFFFVIMTLVILQRTFFKEDLDT